MQDPRAAYLESQVLTATPQKLRLMLIEGALRFLYRAEAGYDSEPIDRAMVSESLTRARNIVAELLSSVKDEEQGPNQQVASLYLFIFQQLTESQLRGDRAPLREITEILTVERETWRQMCEKFPDAPDPAEMRNAQPQEIVATTPAIPPRPHSPHPANGAANAGTESGGFSIEA